MTHGYWIGQDGEQLVVEGLHSAVALQYLKSPSWASASGAYVEMFSRGFARVSKIDMGSVTDLNIQAVEPFSDAQVSALRGISKEMDQPTVNVDVGYGHEISNEGVEVLSFDGTENWARIRAQVAEAAEKKKAARPDVDPELAERLATKGAKKPSAGEEKARKLAAFASKDRQALGSKRKQEPARKSTQVGTRGGVYYITGSGKKVYVRQ